MASVIKPLKRYKRTAWRKKYLTQSQRWGKVVITKMPVPSGEITTSQINNPEPEDVQLPEEPTEVEQKEEEKENE